MNPSALTYARAVFMSFKNAHDLPFKGNEDYWHKRIIAFELMGELHSIERGFMKSKDELPIDTYLQYLSRIESLKGIVKQRISSIPALDKSTPASVKTKDIWEKIEKIAED
jgi:hypothetical protein